MDYIFPVEFEGKRYCYHLLYLTLENITILHLPYQVSGLGGNLVLFFVVCVCGFWLVGLIVWGGEGLGFFVVVFEFVWVLLICFVWFFFCVFCFVVFSHY